MDASQGGGPTRHSCAMRRRRHFFLWSSHTHLLCHASASAFDLLTPPATARPLSRIWSSSSRPPLTAVRSPSSRAPPRAAGRMTQSSSRRGSGAPRALLLLRKDQKMLYT